MGRECDIVCMICGLRKRQKERQHYERPLIRRSLNWCWGFYHGIWKSTALSRKKQGPKSTITADCPATINWRLQNTVIHCAFGNGYTGDKGWDFAGHHHCKQSVHHPYNGSPNDFFSINIGIGKLIQNLAVAAAETLLVTWLFLAVDVPEMLWTEHVEKGIVKEIT